MFRKSLSQQLVGFFHVTLQLRRISKNDLLNAPNTFDLLSETIIESFLGVDVNQK